VLAYSLCIEVAVGQCPVSFSVDDEALGTPLGL
jgi:hypothetical protein